MARLNKVFYFSFRYMVCKKKADLQFRKVFWLFFTSGESEINLGRTKDLWYSKPEESTHRTQSFGELCKREAVIQHQSRSVEGRNTQSMGLGQKWWERHFSGSFSTGAVNNFLLFDVSCSDKRICSFFCKHNCIKYIWVLPACLPNC